MIHEDLKLSVGYSHLVSLERNMNFEQVQIYSLNVGYHLTQYIQAVNELIDEMKVKYPHQFRNKSIVTITGSNSKTDIDYFFDKKNRRDLFNNHHIDVYEFGYHPLKLLGKALREHPYNSKPALVVVLRTANTGDALKDEISQCSRFFGSAELVIVVPVFTYKL